MIFVVILLAAGLLSGMCGALLSLHFRVSDLERAAKGDG